MTYEVEDIRLGDDDKIVKEKISLEIGGKEIHFNPTISEKIRKEVIKKGRCAEGVHANQLVFIYKIITLNEIPELSNYAYHCLLRIKVKTIFDLLSTSDETIENTRGVGPKTFKEIKQVKNFYKLHDPENH